MTLTHNHTRGMHAHRVQNNEGGVVDTGVNAWLQRPIFSDRQADKTDASGRPSFRRKRRVRLRIAAYLPLLPDVS